MTKHTSDFYTQQRLQDEAVRLAAQKEAKRHEDAYQYCLGTPSRPSTKSNIWRIIAKNAAAALLLLGVNVHYSNACAEKEQTVRTSQNATMDSALQLKYFSMFAALVIFLWSIASVRKRGQKFDTVDMMLDMERLGKKFNMSTATVQELVKVAPDIIQKMSGMNRAFFKMLMSNQIDIQNDKAMQTMAEQIIIGHLKMNPNDAGVVINAFEQAGRQMPKNVVVAIANADRVEHVAQRVRVR